MSSSSHEGQLPLSNSLVGTQIQLRIEKMVVGGAGLGRVDGLVVFVDYAAPGDTLLVEITEHKKNLAYAKIIKILVPSKHRTSPPCQHFGVCGGCVWQHLSPAEQLSQKESILKDSLKDLEKLATFQIRPIIPSPQHYHYRNRVQMIFDGAHLNFRVRRSHELVPIQFCHLVEPPLANVIANPPRKSLQHHVRWDLRITPESQTPQLTALDEEVEVVGFSQVNRFQNEELIQTVLQSVSNNPDGDLFELYAGSGNFTFPLFESFRFRHIWAVEGSPALVKSAHDVLRSRNISSRKVSFHLSDVGQFLKSKWPEPQDTVFLDPPRVGADEFVIKTIALSRPQSIIYLSCHPVTLARDLKRLLTYTPQYRIDFIQPFEMFPQTDHLETLVSLSLTQF